MTAGGHLLALQALEACRRLDRDAGDSAFLREKIGTARFFIEQMVPPATTLLPAIKGSAAALGFLRG